MHKTHSLALGLINLHWGGGVWGQAVSNRPELTSPFLSFIEVQALLHKAHRGQGSLHPAVPTPRVSSPAGSTVAHPQYSPRGGIQGPWADPESHRHDPLASAHSHDHTQLQERLGSEVFILGRHFPCSKLGGVII